MKRKKPAGTVADSQILEQWKELRHKQLPDLLQEIAGGLHQLQSAERNLGKKVLAEVRRRTRPRRRKKDATRSGPA